MHPISENEGLIAMATYQPNLASWPLDSIDDEGRWSWAKNDISIRDSLLNILLTSPGERVQRPEFGAGLMQFVHQPNTETTRQLIAGVVKKSISMWEPRIQLTAVKVISVPGQFSEVSIDIQYRFLHEQLHRELSFSLNLGV
jgi:phage baseplate assembly protein W